MAAVENGHHWRSLAVYGFFVAVVVATLAGYQIRTNHRLEQVDQASCDNRRVLVQNQQIVLTILDRNVREFVKASKDAAQHAYFVQTHRLIDNAQKRLNETLVCD